ncbi:MULTISPECIES: DNA gyrase inhibitor YacG [unclassified Mesorhizobium]|uniref:DNA gyrase inhibitor YacG n=1 Tax=unclassified Mesorhizobium TaxID=325217 RepID=UPI000BAEF991|nr:MULTISPECIES: DNA gyrase inhibitor YacG [unclassified Mesorhizobium]WIE91486.1 DNA gyrase inhibitor YacG [Mesorhizobium sp. WSM4875]PBB39643.1 DNA gyrase inhibitor YacG [Mesorhizobium sp. WSM3868]RUW02046.1 DNA gyrase inhibitor YacG [Mesorhizobium sp. M1A.F.Ca.IN.020.04.1.1]RUW09740.1 DNA gyrase inhibitor YacG [Mesorhizobium sp. M1A.F.Ca.IN.020.03.1.1]RWF70672.1 MAG: DNA gyrase inhibitor YacG [Mesorhizobium sp.]
MSPDEKVTPLRPKRPCPECGKPSVREHYPFCSTRCKDIDLNRWLKGAYVIPGRDDAEEEDGGPKQGPSSTDEQ